MKKSKKEPAKKTAQKSAQKPAKKPGYEKQAGDVDLRSQLVRALGRVLNERMSLDAALALFSRPLERKERAWALEMLSGVLRWKGRLEFALEELSDKKRPSGWLGRALLLSVYQVLQAGEESAVAGIVSETVEMVKRKEGGPSSKFANALLRKFATHRERFREGGVDAHLDPHRQAQWASLPDWLWERLKAQRGLEWASRYAQVSLERPRLWIRARPEASQIQDWALKGPIEGAYLIPQGGLISERPGFKEGEFIVQDISSQRLVTEIAKTVRERIATKKMQALDFCAAPGGKAAALAWSGFDVTASDVHPARLLLLEDTIERVAPNIAVKTGEDLKQIAPQQLVWVDAPCTGSGILRRQPDVRWAKEEKDLASLVNLQTELLKDAWQYVDSGGFLAYSVCSVLKEEGESVLASFQDKVQSTKIQSWSLSPQEKPYGDGFFAGLLQRP